MTKRTFPSEKSMISQNKISHRTQAPKRVRIADYSSMRIARGWSNEEMHASWYSKLEIEQFKKDVRQSTYAVRKTTDASSSIRDLAFSVAKDADIPSSSSSSAVLQNAEDIRGIEHLVSNSVLILMLKRRKLVISHVLQEQAMQKIMGRKDVARIAQVSMTQSRYSRAWSSGIARVEGARAA